MDKYTATELAFKHGYEKGYEAGIAKEKKAYCDGLLDGRRAALECVPLAKWIPVGERLPEKNGRYICNYHFGNNRDMTFTQVLDYYAIDTAPHFQHTLDGIMKVTHWMPLPEPPEEELL